MILFILLTGIFIICSFYKFKETFLFYMALKMLALSAMCLKYTPPALAMNTALNIFFVIQFYRKGHLKEMWRKKDAFPLKTYYVLSLVSIFLSGIFSIMPFSSFVNGVIMTLLDEFLLAFIFWYYVRGFQDITFFLKSCMFVMTVACLFGLYEFVADNNPFVDFLYTNVDSDLLKGKIYVTEKRLGLRRVLSLFVSPNNFIYGAFVTLMLFAYSKYLKPKFKYFLPFSLLSLLCIVLANSRTVLMASLIMLLPVFIDFKNVQTRKFLTVMFLILLVAAPFLSHYLSNITSVISSSTSSEIEGSSVQGRMVQFEGSFQLFMRSPLFGNGLDSISYFVSDKGGFRWIILGTESIWMKLMIERGILGIIAYCTLFYDMVKNLGAKNNKILLFCMLGYLVGNTMSSMPGFSLSFFYISMFVIYKIIKLHENRHRYHLLHH